MSTLRLAHRKDQQTVWARQRLRTGKLFARDRHQADIARRLWYLLHQLGWSVQRPVVAARERDEAAIEAWRRRQWPRVRKRGTTTWGLDRVRR